MTGMSPATGETSPRTGNLTASEAMARSSLVSGVRYTVVLDLTRGDREFSCQTLIRFLANTDGSTFLDYTGAVRRIECNESPLWTDAYDGSRVHVPVRKGENTILIYGASSYSREGSGLHLFRDPVDGECYVHTAFEPFGAHRVYPCFDQPDIKATWTLRVTVPAHWLVIANADPAAPPATLADDRARWTFTPTRPLPPYLTAMAAGPFHRLDIDHRGVRLGLCARAAVFDQLTTDAPELFEVTAAGLDFYVGLFDRSYPFGKYDQVFVPEYPFSAVEHPGCVTINERFVFRSRVTEEARRSRAGLILHEMAHMWFGDLVTMRWWDDLWLNESFATLLATIARDEATRLGGAWASFTHQAAVAARHADRLPTSHPVSADVPDTDAARLSFNPITYRKGAAVLHQLANHLGRESFLAGVRTYLSMHAWSNADLADFLDSLQRASGLDLAEWAQEWLQRPGANTVEVRRSPSGARVRQAADIEPRHLRLRLGQYVATSGGLRLDAATTAELTAEHPEWTVPGSTPAVVLPNDDGACYVKVRLDRESRDTLRAQLSTLEDPIARAVAWGALWDDVVDARLPARHFLSCVLAHAMSEDDIGTLELLWMRAIRAVNDYGDRTHVTTALASVSARIRAELEEAVPGSDRQLVLARVFVAAAHDNDLAELLVLAEGGSPWRGLHADPDVRWRALLRLAAAGKVTAELIAAARADDPGEAGDRQALMVDAARADPDAKEVAWSRVFNEEYSLTQRRAIMTAIPQPGQEALLTSYVDRYFSELTRLGGAAAPETALAFVRALYPRITTIDRQVLSRTDAVLRGERIPREIRRILQEERAELSLAMAARTCDAQSAARSESAGRATINDQGRLHPP